MNDRKNSEWRTARIRDLLAQRKEHAGPIDPLLSVTLERGVVPQAESGRRDISSANKWAYWRVYPEDIVYNTMRMWQGVSSRSDHFGIVSPAYTVCMPRPGADIDTRFLSLVFKLPAYIAAFRSRSQGLVSDTWNLKYGSFAEISITVPGVAEQRRISDILYATDEAIRSTERLIAKLERARQALFRDLLSRGVGSSGRLRDPDCNSEQFGNSALGLIPEGWNVVCCAEICQSIVVGIVVKPAQYYTAEGVPILRSANVRESGIDMTDLKFMSQRSHRALEKSSVRSGDVLTVRTGYPGTSAAITEKVGEANCVDVIISRPGSAILPEYLALWINSPLGKGQVLAGQGGLAQQHFNVGQMKKLLVALPSLTEQRAITEIVSDWEARTRAENEALKKLQALKRGLMNDLLTGRVRTKASA